MGAGLVGADIEALRTVARALDEAGAALERVRAEVDGRLRGVVWHGPGAANFRSRWSALDGQRVLTVAALLRETGARVRANADAQESTSAAGGAAGGTPGAVHGGADVAPAGGPSVAVGAPGAVGTSGALAPSSAPGDGDRGPQATLPNPSGTRLDVYRMTGLNRSRTASGRRARASRLRPRTRPHGDRRTPDRIRRTTRTATRCPSPARAGGTRRAPHGRTAGARRSGRARRGSRGGGGGTTPVRT